MMTKQLFPLIFILTTLFLTTACGGDTRLPTTPEPAPVEPNSAIPEAPPSPSTATGPVEQIPPPGELVSAPDVTVAYIREGNLWMWREASGPVQMTDSGGLTTVSLSGDGQWLAFQRGAEIWLARVDGTDVRQLLADANGANRLRFAPGGSLLALASNTRIDLVDLSTGGSRSVIRYPAIEAGYAPEVLWMPDASAFKTVIPPQAGGGQAEYFYLFTDGTLASLAKFTMVSPMKSAPFLSPDGGYLIYVAKLEDKESLYLMDSSGATKPYGEAADTVRAYGWLPDSKRFAYALGDTQRTVLGDVSGPPIALPSNGYDRLRWVDGERFLGLRAGSLYLGNITGQNTSLDAGVTDFDFVY